MSLSCYSLLNMSIGEYVSISTYDDAIGGNDYMLQTYYCRHNAFHNKIWYLYPPSKVELLKISEHLSIPVNALEIMAI